MLLDVVIEVPRGGFVKRRANGELDFVSPVPCPYNYGHVVGTTGGDGDPIDVIVPGRRLPIGTRLSLQPQAAIRFIDAGAVDDKIICGQRPLLKRQKLTLQVFFAVYARAKHLLNRARGEGGPTYVEGWVALEQALASMNDGDRG